MAIPLRSTASAAAGSVGVRLFTSLLPSNAPRVPPPSQSKTEYGAKDVLCGDQGKTDCSWTDDTRPASDRGRKGGPCGVGSATTQPPPMGRPLARYGWE